jgi:glycosyltransferase involved in cell wall biosynthesis
MAMGRPVVSTTIGAEGLPVTSGEHVLLADSPEAFAEQVSALLKDPAKGKAVADNGYSLVTRKYSWKNVAQRLFEVCGSTLRATD